MNIREKVALAMEKVVMLSVVFGDLLEKTWEFYVQSFPEGYSMYLRDFEKEQFMKSLQSPNFIKFYFTENSEILGFAMITKDARSMEIGTDIDPFFFQKKSPASVGKLYWISIFAIKEGCELKVIAPLAAKMFNYIFSEGCMASFSRELEEVPTMIRMIRKVCKNFLGFDIGEREISHEITSVIWKI